MKYTLIFVALLFTVMVSAQTAKVYFMRLPTKGTFTNSKFLTGYSNVLIDGKVTCKLNQKKYTIREVPAGIHEFNMQPAGQTSGYQVKPVTMELEAGKTYYIQLVFNYNKVEDIAYCKILTEERAMMMIEDLKEDKSCVVEKLTQP